MDWLLRIVLAGAVIWAGFALLVWTFQRSLIYYPDTTVYDPAMTPAPEMRIVRYHASDDIELVSWYWPAPAGRPTILLFHGNAGNAAHRTFKARALIEAGFGVLLAEFRGYGGSGGAPGEAGLMRDGHAAMAFLAGEGVAPEQIILMGESLGTGVAVALAAEMSSAQPPAALILEAGYSSMTDVAAGIYAFLPVRLIIRDRFDSAALIAQVNAPLLMVHGANDEIIAPAIGRRLFEAAEEPKEWRLIEGAGHNDVWDRGGGEAALHFLARRFPIN